MMTFLTRSIIFLIAVLPLAYLSLEMKVPVKAFLFGTGSWGIGCILKILAYSLFVQPLHQKGRSLKAVALLNGFLSGLFELSASVLIILLVRHKYTFDPPSIIGFGLAIGAFESLIVVFSSGNELFKGTSLEKSSAETIRFLEGLRGSKSFLFNMVCPVTERMIATTLHVATRGMVFTALSSRTPLPFLAAMAVFVVADGWLGYYDHATGRLSTERGYLKIHLYLLMLALVSITAYIESIT
ncbi:MAG: hypothetical protein QUS35_01975 [bacterium]|nr:hypothetical protein [bacterium]